MDTYFETEKVMFFEIHILFGVILPQPLFPGESGVDQLVEIIKVSLWVFCDTGEHVHNPISFYCLP